MSDEFFPAAERALAAAAAARETPLRWTLTSALYAHLDATRIWRDHAERAQYGREEPRPLYGLPVGIELDAWQGWKLHLASGGYIDQTGRLAPPPPAR